MSASTLLVRADANAQMGTGHVMRCLALAQAWQDAGGEVVFACADLSARIEERLRAERIHLAPLHALSGSPEDSAQLTELAAHYRPDWVVVDGYQFSRDYHVSIRSSGHRVLVVDDSGSCGPDGADMVLNQNLHARQEMYRDLKAETKLLLGPRFAMLRREFTRWRGWRREISQIGWRVLITMGGGDAENHSARVCEALQDLYVEGVEIRVVVGSSNPHLASLRSIAEKWKGQLRLEQKVSDMSELMVWADVAVSCAGSTCWEICMLGLPSVLQVLAENQRPVAADLSRMGIAIEAGPDGQPATPEIIDSARRLLMSSDLRKEMSQRACDLVDGRGAERVVAALRDFALRSESGARGEGVAPLEAAGKRGQGVGV
jgi:UDP-2,4-diacetamido-2,4,6-trideoxy-beta-L-altropyranose hydrolase